jgi:ribokinase
VLQLEVPIAAIEAVARRARQAGARVLLNFAPFRAEALGLLAHVTHLIVNEHECALIASALGHEGEPTRSQADILAERFALTVIATLGSKGAVSAGRDSKASAPALPVEVVDTVGAGDTFCGYLAAVLGGGKIIGEAMRLASAAGSLACTKPGAQPSIPTRAEVEAAMKARDRR